MGKHGKTDDPSVITHGRWYIPACLPADAREFVTVRLLQAAMFTQVVFWLVVWNILYFSIYWELSSQLTFIFFRGVDIPPASFGHVSIYAMYQCLGVHFSVSFQVH